MNTTPSYQPIPYKIYLVVITLIGIGLRIFSFNYNNLPHGDIHLDIAAGWGFLNHQELVLPYFTTHPYQSAIGVPLDQHAPVWPVLGGMGATITDDVFLALKLASMMAGILLIPVAFYAFQKAFGQSPALLASSCISLSYLLVDYSGNGSLYILHALLFLLMIWFINTESMLNAVLIGSMIGIGYLLNYQTIVTIFALLGVYLVKFISTRDFKINTLNFLVTILVALLVTAPWLWRNFQIFGNPFYSTNPEFILTNLGVPVNIQLVGDAFIRNTEWAAVSLSQIPIRIISWTARNLIYFLVRIIVLAPIISFFAFVGIGQMFFKRNRSLPDAAWLTFWFFLFHLAISCLWPVFKFRYFVPILPLTFGLGSYGVFSILKSSMQLRLAVVSTLTAILAVNMITFIRVPSHTAYYDTNELITYRTGEAEWQVNERLLIDAASRVKGATNTPVIGGPNLFYYLNRPVVLANNISDPLVIRYLTRKYRVEYIIDTNDRTWIYDTALDIEEIYQNKQYSVYKVNQDIP